MKKIRKLDHNLFTAVVISALGVLGFIASCFLISTPRQDIPFGFLLASGVIATVHFISYLLCLIDKRNGTSIFTVISMALRLMVLLVTLVLIALMNYRWDMKLFNMFVFVGMYTAGIIVLCLSFVFNKEWKEEEVDA